MFTADLLERAAKTFVQVLVVTFVLAMTATVSHGVDLSLAWWQAAAGAALTAALTAAASAASSLLSLSVGVKGTASILPVPAIPATSTVTATIIEPPTFAGGQAGLAGAVGDAHSVDPAVHST